MLGLLLAGFAHARAAVSINLYNTGVNGGGSVLPDGTVGDPHYNLTVVPLGSTTQTLTRTSAGGFPIPPYVPDDSKSTWIGPNNDHQLDGPGGKYIYETTFSLTGLVPSTAQISGVWTTDNAGLDILINGHSTGQTIAYGSGTVSDPYSYAEFHPFTITSGFVSGLNTLDFVIMNGNGGSDTAGPTALRVEMSGTANVIPEPASLVTWGLLGVCLAARSWLRKRR